MSKNSIILYRYYKFLYFTPFYLHYTEQKSSYHCWHIFNIIFLCSDRSQSCLFLYLYLRSLIPDSTSHYADKQTNKYEEEEEQQQYEEKEDEGKICEALIKSTRDHSLQSVQVWLAVPIINPKYVYLSFDDLRIPCIHGATGMSHWKISK